jgi:outer membrane protein assembly factor BamB
MTNSKRLSSLLSRTKLKKYLLGSTVVIVICSVLMLQQACMSSPEPDLQTVVYATASTAYSLSAAQNEIDPDVWPQWRGPTRDGKVAVKENAPAWPDAISDKNMTSTWQVSVGKGYSSPIVSRDHIFTVETSQKKYEVVRAMDRKTGKQVWERQWDGAMTVPFFANRNGSWVRSTPAFDGKSLYVGGMRDFLVCLDAKTGKVNWQVDFVKRFKSPNPSFGFVCSPLVAGDHLYVQAGGAFVKLNKKTGETVWRTLSDGGAMYGSAFSSPVIANIQGKPQLIVQTRASLAGVDPDDGKVLWTRKIKAFRGMNILTPTIIDNAVLASTYGGRTQMIKIDKNEKGFSTSVAWDNRLQGYMSSPVVIGNYIYLHMRSKRLACVDLTTGEIKWTTSRSFGDYWSMVSRGQKILALDQNGMLYLIRANPEKFDLIDERRVSDGETWAHLAVVGTDLFVRELNSMMVFDWKNN